MPVSPLEVDLTSSCQKTQQEQKSEPMVAVRGSAAQSQVRLEHCPCSVSSWPRCSE
jgi:hypothetical protein